MEYSLLDFCVFVCKAQNKLDAAGIDYPSKFMFSQLHHAIMNAAAAFIRANGGDGNETLNFLIQCRREAGWVNQ